MTQERSAFVDSVKGKIYHPLLNIALPDTTELRARCGDSDAVQVLDAACRLAELRCSKLNDIRDAILEHSGVPYFGKSTQVEASREPELTETDILRALLALQKSFVAAALFDPARIQIRPSETFHRMANHWREALGSCPQAVPRLPIVQSWARRWAMMFLESPSLRVGVSTWLSSVMHALPADFSNVFVEGLFTADEGREHMEGAYREYLKRRNHPANPFPKCPPAYLDRHGLLDAANDLLATSKGLFLVGSDEGARRHLMCAISSDVNYAPALTALEEIRGGGGHRFSARALELRKISGANTSVLALTGNLPEEVDGQAWCLDPFSLAYQGQACESLGFFKWLASADAEANVRYVVSMSPEEWTTLVQAVPDVAGLVRLDVPSAQDLDVIPAFLVSLPEVLERHSSSVPLGLLLDFLYQLSLFNPAYLAVGHARSLIDLVSPERTDLGLLNPLPSISLFKTPFERLSRRSLPIRLRVGPARSMADAAEGFFSKYIGDLFGLESLIVLHETVTLLSEPAPGERIFGLEKGSAIVAESPVVSGSSPGSTERGTSSQSSSSKGSYARAVSELPLPSEAQTARFASYVAEAHSWYKHLPLHPMTPFLFFLDPLAGMTPGMGGGGKTSGLQELRASDHTESDVDEYRERFGHWNYHVDIGRTAVKGFEQLLRTGSSVDRYRFSSRIEGIDGEALTAPPAMMLAGMAKLSAFVHPACAIHIWIDMARNHESWNPFTYGITLDQAPRDLPDGLRSIWACFNTPNWYPPLDPGKLTEHDALLAALAADPASPISWREETAVMKIARELGGVHLYAQVLFAVELLRTTSSTNEAFERHLGSTPDDVARGLIDRLVYERMRQIQSMKDAMNRFLGCLH